MTFKATSFTCVMYGSGDKVGKLLAYVSLAPLLVFCHQASKVYTRREMHELALFVGLVLNEGIARVLKHMIRQERPPEKCEALDLCHSHGMPSSHTQCMFFYLVFCTWFSLRRFNQHESFTKFWSALELLALAALSVLVAVSRVYLGYHFSHQVIGGAILGCVTGCAWYATCSAFSGHFQRLCTSPPFTLLYFKTTWNVVHPLVEEKQLHHNKQA